MDAKNQVLNAMREVGAPVNAGKIGRFTIRQFIDDWTNYIIAMRKFS